MCNAYRHPPGCMCGWGGDGHLGGGGVGYSWTTPKPYDSERAKRWHNKSMSQLAAELGRSVLFPVRCRHCGDDIYLFADPNGGFAMFDDIGQPWPKHRCFRMPYGPVPYYIPPSPFSPEYDMPVPIDVKFGEYDSGQRLQGAVVRVRPARIIRSDGGVSDIVLYNGRALFKICARQVLSIGAFVAGMPRFVAGIGTCLEEVELIEPATVELVRDACQQGPPPNPALQRTRPAAAPSDNMRLALGGPVR